MENFETPVVSVAVMDLNQWVGSRENEGEILPAFSDELPNVIIG